MANIRITKQSIMLCREAGITSFLWGHRGMGKSSIVAQLAEKSGIGIIDLRLSQMEAADIRGLPAKEDGRTVYYPPADMPVGDMEPEEIQKILKDIKDPDEYHRKWVDLQPRYKKGILFLDELNRAADDVQQAAFQLVLDKRIGQYALPTGWSIVCAGNFMDGDYVVNSFNDAAFIDRFAHLILTRGGTGIEDWVAFMTEQYGAKATAVIEFASHNDDNLYGKVKGDLGFDIQPSPRSWEMVTKALIAAGEGEFAPYPQEVLSNVIAGIIGRDLTVTFERYNCPVKPRDVVRDGVAKWADLMKDLERGQMLGLMYGLISVLKPNITKDNEGQVSIDYLRFMLDNHADKDIAIAFARSLVEGDDPNESSSNAYVGSITNPKLGQLIGGFRKKSGKKGFLDRLVAEKDLHEKLSKVGWGATSD